MVRARILTSLLFVLAACGVSYGADIKIIANASIGVSTITAEELKNVFLANKTSLADGSHVEPVLGKGATHDVFLRTYLAKSGAALDTYYRSLVFTGKGSMPKTLGSDADVVSYVAKTRGAIGYVNPASPVAGVKTLEVR
jgi:ABC-type phosphate transport system substrate-binding protein